MRVSGERAHAVMTSIGAVPAWRSRGHAVTRSRGRAGAPEEDHAYEGHDGNDDLVPDDVIGLSDAPWADVITTRDPL